MDNTKWAEYRTMHADKMELLREIKTVLNEMSGGQDGLFKLLTATDCTAQDTFGAQEDIISLLEKLGGKPVDATAECINKAKAERVLEEEQKIFADQLAKDNAGAFTLSDPPPFTGAKFDSNNIVKEFEEVLANLPTRSGKELHAPDSAEAQQQRGGNFASGGVIQPQHRFNEPSMYPNKKEEPSTVAAHESYMEVANKTDHHTIGAIYSILVNDLVVHGIACTKIYQHGKIPDHILDVFIKDRYKYMEHLENRFTVYTFSLRKD